MSTGQFICNFSHNLATQIQHGTDFCSGTMVLCCPGHNKPCIKLSQHVLLHCVMSCSCKQYCGTLTCGLMTVSLLLLQGPQKDTRISYSRSVITSFFWSLCLLSFQSHLGSSPTKGDVSHVLIVKILCISFYLLCVHMDAFVGQAWGKAVEMHQGNLQPIRHQIIHCVEPCDK